jgi:hypothetical protein
MGNYTDAINGLVCVISYWMMNIPQPQLLFDQVLSLYRQICCFHPILSPNFEVWLSMDLCQTSGKVILVF